VIAYVVNLLPLCKYEKIRTDEEAGYLCDPDTIASYCPHFLLRIRKIGANVWMLT
jgi:hypothetical protein